MQLRFERFLLLTVDCVMPAALEAGSTHTDRYQAMALETVCCALRLGKLNTTRTSMRSSLFDEVALTGAAIEAV